MRMENKIEEKIIEYGVDSITDEELLKEIVGVSEASSNYAGIRDFLDTEHDDIGITAKIEAVKSLIKRYLKQRVVGRKVRLNNSSAVADYIKVELRGSKKEKFMVLFLNAQNVLLDSKIMFEGSDNSATVYPAEIIRHALKVHALAIILAHNHPSGDTEPSETDIEVTKDILYAGKFLSIDVIEHIITGGDGYFSMADSGLIRNFKSRYELIRREK
jgi:DNA repair protein RadC